MKQAGSILNQYLRKKRLEAGLTQKELAEELGYRSQFIANWERGVSAPPAHVYPKLIQILNIPEQEILELLYAESRRYWQSVILPRKKVKKLKKA